MLKKLSLLLIAPLLATTAFADCKKAIEVEFQIESMKSGIEVNNIRFADSQFHELLTIERDGEGVMSQGSGEAAIVDSVEIEGDNLRASMRVCPGIYQMVVYPRPKSGAEDFTAILGLDYATGIALENGEWKEMTPESRDPTHHFKVSYRVIQSQ